jgi:hypothetical protein
MLYCSCNPYNNTVLVSYSGVKEQKALTISSGLMKMILMRWKNMMMMMNVNNDDNTQEKEE